VPCDLAMGKSTATRIRQGTRLGKAQRDRLRQLEQAQQDAQDITSTAPQEEQLASQGEQSGSTGEAASSSASAAEPAGLPLTVCEHRDAGRPLDEDLEEALPSPAKMRRSRNSGWADEAEMDAPEGSASQPSLGTGEPPSSLTAPIMTSFTEPELHDTTTIDSSSSSPEMIPATGPNQHRPARSQRSRSSRYPPLPEDQRPEESRCNRPDAGVATIDIVFLQETHWAEDSRLLMVKAQKQGCCHYLINIYQKVHDGSKDGSLLRSTIWDALQKAVSTCPSRHSLVIAGDFNTGLQACAPHTGSAVIGKGNAADAPDAHVLQRMLKQFDLRALNTFQPAPGAFTFQHQEKGGKLQLENPEDFQQAVQHRLQRLDSWNTQEINRVLQEEMQCRLVPTDLSAAYDQPDAEMPVKSLWHCHRELKALQQVDTVEAETQRRNLKKTFTQLQRQVRSISKLKRHAFIDDCVQRATQAARQGDIREVHLQVNKIAPKVVRRRPQLRDAQGRIMTTQQETRALQQFWQGVYVSQHPRTPDPLPSYVLPPKLLEDALASLPQHKSLPKHYAPGVTWKLAASSVAALARRTILNDWQLDRFWVPPEWRHAWLCFILKPNKSGRKAEEYRPIGLTDPVGKALLGAVSTQHRQALYDSVALYPQFAYMANRGVSQALMRAFQHLHQARALVAEQRTTLQQRHAGASRSRLVGAITVSLDMSKAFDSLEPKYMHQALELSCLPDAVCRLIEHWHAEVTYHFEHEQCQAQIACGRGIRQGCKIAPRVWSLFTILVMHEIGPEWCKKHSNWFADDALFQAMVHSEEELLQHIRAISKALWVLQKLGMSIAASKSAVLLHLGGTAAKKVKAKIVQLHNQQQHVIFQHDDQTWRLPVVAQHDYLGATLSYTRMEDLTATRRVRAAQASFERLKTVLTHKALALRTRLRIWQACVISSLLYAMPQVSVINGFVHSMGSRIPLIDARLSEDILACEARVLAQLHIIARDRCGCPCTVSKGTKIHLRGSHAQEWKQDLNGDKLAPVMEEVLGPLFPALKEVISEGGFGENNPNKRSRPDPDMIPPPKGKGAGKGKGKNKSKGQRQQENTWGGYQDTRFRPFGPQQGSWRDAQGLDVEAAVYALAKLCLRQETELSEIRQEKCFLLHISAAPHGILKPLIRASLRWNELRDQMKVDCSLKSELFRLMLKETAARMEKFEQTPESQKAAEK
ncbi:unnamed protein product, partial [Symbiodinium necroappetens]